MAPRVVFGESAWRDVDEIYDWVADRGGPETAHAYLARIQAHCQRLKDFPDRGTPRDELGIGVRTIVFENKAAIAYVAGDQEVRILHIFHRGRDPGRAR